MVLGKNYVKLLLLSKASRYLPTLHSIIFGFFLQSPNGMNFFVFLKSNYLELPRPKVLDEEETRLVLFAYYE